MKVFIFYDEFDRIKFKCPLKKAICKGFDKQEKNCLRYTEMVHPYCLNCIKKYLNLEIKNSGELNGGKGLFAYKKKNKEEPIFKKGDFIAPYLGEVVTTAELQKRYTGKKINSIICPYVVETKNGTLYDGAIYRGPAIYGNDKPKHNNAVLVEDKNEVFACATKNIYDGDEIFIDYGKHYWSGQHLKFEIIDE